MSSLFHPGRILANRLRELLMFRRYLLSAFMLASIALPGWAQEVPLGGFIPFVGIGLTDEFKTFDDDVFYFEGETENSYVGNSLGSGYTDIALLDTGAAVHIITDTAAGSSGFDINSEGFSGTNFQEIFGATGGSLFMTIDDPLGIFAAGLGDRVSAGSSLVMDPNDYRGQSSVSVLEAGSDWTLPNILGLPMAAQQGIHILNSQPEIFEYQGRTMRTPQVEFFDIGQGDQQGIIRRAQLKLLPSESFTAGPVYIPSLVIDPNNLDFDFHDNPTTPTVVSNGGLFLEVDIENNGTSNQNVDFLFDTGADLTVVSEFLALNMGIDVVLDEPDFLIEVEGAGGVAGGVPGYFVEQMEIDAVGGSLTLENVPVVVLNVPDPLSPANIIDAIIGMHVFAGRDLVIDAAPAATVPSANGPTLYISDPVTEVHQWSTTAATADWATGGHWSSPGVPGNLWIAQAANVSGSDQVATVSANSTVFELQVSGGPAAKMTVDVQSGITLTTFGQALIEAGGEVHLDGGKLDSQVVNIEGGTLSGNGEVFAGTGPINGVVRNLSGLIAPDGLLTVTGDLSNLENGTIAIDLFDGGNDLLDVTRFAFLGGTLEVTLEAGFTPTEGQQFTIFTYGSGVDLDFDHLLLPSGYNWNLFDDSFSDSVILEAVSVATIPGDFDGNGVVNHLDLEVWEAGFGTIYTGLDFLVWQQNLTPTLPGDFNNDNVVNHLDLITWQEGYSSGLYDGLDFLVWQQNLGAGSVQINSTPVPEPTSIVLASLAAVIFSRRRR